MITTCIDEAAHYVEILKSTKGLNCLELLGGWIDEISWYGIIVILDEWVFHVFNNLIGGFLKNWMFQSIKLEYKEEDFCKTWYTWSKFDYWKCRNIAFTSLKDSLGLEVLWYYFLCARWTTHHVFTVPVMSTLLELTVNLSLKTLETCHPLSFLLRPSITR